MLKKYEVDFSIYGWRGNPFTLEIIPHAFVGYEKQKEELLKAINQKEKHILITGATGSGKTTLCLWIKENVKEYNTIYFPKPPRNIDQFIAILKEKLICRGIRRLFCWGRIDEFNIIDKIKKINKPTLIIIDEGHETTPDMLEWIRTIVDHIPQGIVLFVGLPLLKEHIRNNLETLSQRIVKEIKLDALSKNETYEIIKKRIETYGGKGIEPFTSDFVNKIYSITGGFPREILKLCDSALQKAIEEKAHIIDATYLQDEKEDKIAPKVESKIEEITDKQREIINILSHEPLTPRKIIKRINIQEYKSELHALRAINNILKRLENMGLVVREKRGRSYIYTLSPIAKNILIDK